MLVLFPAPNFEQVSLWLEENGRDERKIEFQQPRCGGGSVQLNVIYVLPKGLGHVEKQPKKKRHYTPYYFPQGRKPRDLVQTKLHKRLIDVRVQGVRVCP